MQLIPGAVTPLGLLNDNELKVQLFIDKDFIETNYDEVSCKRIEFIKCMRNAGVEIEILIEYMNLFEKRKTTVLLKAKGKILLKRYNKYVKNKRG